MALRDLFLKKKTCALLVNVEGKVVDRYRRFKDFLRHNHDALNLMAELERAYYSGSAFGMGAVRKAYEELMRSTRALTEALGGMSNDKYAGLAVVLDRIDEEVSGVFAPELLPATGDLVLPFEVLTPEMARLAGGKATNLATVRNALGMPVPDGFVVTAHAFERFLDESGLSGPVAEMLEAAGDSPSAEMEENCRAIQEMIRGAEVPVSIAQAILGAYETLEGGTRKNVRIAMRSSAVGEDTQASFAGQYITELNVTRENILDAYKAVLASKYEPRAILYRLRYGLDDRDTPMCVIAIAMVDSRSSGVLYTADPSAPGSSALIGISSIWGLGEYLVSGEASPDIFLVDKRTKQVVKQDIRRKTKRLIADEYGGTILEDAPEDRKDLPSIEPDTVRALAGYGLRLEEHFGCPQDVEWAVDDRSENLFILQSRPLGSADLKVEERSEPEVFPGHPVLLSAGKAASTGTACGVVVLADGRSLHGLPDDAILVAKTASPDYAAFIGNVKGLITDIGSVASHLASVAREFGVPAIVDAGGATSRLEDGAAITMVADSATVYEGIVPELATKTRPVKKHVFESPVHRRLRTVLDKVSPLNLTDPKAPDFSPQGCKTIHDVIRFSHETAMKEMFLLSGSDGGGAVSVKLTSNIPLVLYCIDLGGGLGEMLTTCDAITPDHIESIPMKAIWSGFTHPGITWSGTVNFDLGNLMTLMASSATAEVGGGMPGGDSYAVLSRDYVNLSAKFGYHYANVDAFCGDDPEQNHILLQFSGGAGSYVGRTLRVGLLANVLGRLGFTIAVTGDLLEAAVKGYDMKLMEYTLDQVGRLLASSRLLDMAVPNRARVDGMTEAFFRGDYDFLNQGLNDRLPGFYTHVGQWERIEEAGRVLCLQDGSKWGTSLSSGMARFMGKMVGAKYQEFLDNIGAYYYFPIAVAKDSRVSDAVLSVRVKPFAGSMDRAGGLAFAVRNIGNYFVLRVNALEDNFALFEYVNNRRFQRVSVAAGIETGRWCEIRVETSGRNVRGYLDDRLLIEYTAEKPLSGYVGIWTKADSVTYFSDLTIEADGERKSVGF